MPYVLTRAVGFCSCYLFLLFFLLLILLTIALLPFMIIKTYCSEDDEYSDEENYDSAHCDAVIMEIIMVTSKVVQIRRKR